LVTSWGQPGTSTDDPLIFFGPRSIAIAPDGTLWVTDTGNNRLSHFTADGEPLDVGGTAPSASLTYNEPVDVVVSADGGLLVTDDWSGRILRFGPAPGYEYLGSIDAGWKSQDILHKPYVTALADGRILVSHPESGRLLLFEATGKQVGDWHPLADSIPVGVVAMRDGGFAFSDVGRNEIEIVPAALVDSLFK
jgi:DNA-binding beta-propeller fold protein YncE